MVTLLVYKNTILHTAMVWMMVGLTELLMLIAMAMVLLARVLQTLESKYLLSRRLESLSYAIE